MSLIRILVFAALAVLVYSVLRKATLSMRGGNPTAPDERLGRLEPCAQCGVYVDKHEAMHRRVGGEAKLFCSDRCVLEAKADLKTGKEHQEEKEEHEAEPEEKHSGSGPS